MDPCGAVRVCSAVSRLGRHKTARILSLRTTAPFTERRSSAHRSPDSRAHLAAMRSSCWTDAGLAPWRSIQMGPPSSELWWPWRWKVRGSVRRSARRPGRPATGWNCRGPTPIGLLLAQDPRPCCIATHQCRKWSSRRWSWRKLSTPVRTRQGFAPDRRPGAGAGWHQVDAN